MSGVTYLDAGVLISHLDAADGHHADSANALAQLIVKGERFVTSSVTISEALVRPARESDDALGAAYDVLTQEIEVEVVVLDAGGAIEIARARAEHPSLKTPDAAVIATARLADANRILTTDHRLARFDEAVLVRDFEG